MIILFIDYVIFNWWANIKFCVLLSTGSVKLRKCIRRLFHSKQCSTDVHRYRMSARHNICRSMSSPMLSSFDARLSIRPTNETPNRKSKGQKNRSKKVPDKSRNCDAKCVDDCRFENRANKHLIAHSSFIASCCPHNLFITTHFTRPTENQLVRLRMKCGWASERDAMRTSANCVDNKSEYCSATVRSRH